MRPTRHAIIPAALVPFRALPPADPEIAERAAYEEIARRFGLAQADVIEVERRINERFAPSDYVLTKEAVRATVAKFSDCYAPSPRIVGPHAPDHEPPPREERAR